MFRGLLWLFNSLHKEWGRAGGKGVMQFSIFVQFPAPETMWGHSQARCYEGVFAISPPINAKSAGVSVILQVSVWPLWASRYCCSPLRDNSIFAILPGDYLTSVWVLSSSCRIRIKLHITRSTWSSTVFLNESIFLRSCVQSHCRGSCMKPY